MSYQKQAMRCREKTARGNVYRRHEAAVRAATMNSLGVNYGDKVRSRVEHYHCQICGRYHVGGTGNKGIQKAKRDAKARKRLAKVVLMPLGGVEIAA